MRSYWKVFDRHFFLTHQRKLLWLLNTPIIGSWFRYVLRINGDRSSVGSRRVVSILPHAIKWIDGSGYSWEFRTHHKYAKRLYYAFRPLWWVLHAWDWCVADRLVPRLSFGFSILTKYPDAGSPGTTTVDGRVRVETAGGGAGVSWATLIATATADSVAATDAESNYFYFQAHASTSGNWTQLYRSGFLFDTTNITSGAEIVEATLSLYGSSKNDTNSNTPNIDIYSFAPASNTTLAVGDFDAFGSTSFTDAPISYASWSTTGYNNFTLNADGRGNINKTGVSKFGVRNANKDVAATSPTWAANAIGRINGYFADQTGTTNDPKLVVTYVASDDFNRADEDPLSQGGNWTTGAGYTYALRVVSNQLVSNVTNSRGARRTETFGNDQWMRVKVVTMGASSEAHICVRCQSAVAGRYAFCIGYAGAGYASIKMGDGTWADFTNEIYYKGALTVQAGDYVGVGVVGTTFFVYINDVLRFTGTGTEWSSGYPGIAILNGDTTWVLDDFTAGENNYPRVVVGGSCNIQTDDFNRADETPIGGKWAVITGSEANLTGNQVVAGGATYNRYAFRRYEVYDSNQYSKAKITCTPSGTTEIGGVLVRGRDNTGVFNGYFVSIHGTSYVSLFASYGVTPTYEKIGGTDITVSFALNDVIGLAVSGQDLAVYKNGALIEIRTDSNNRVTSGGTPGVMAYNTGTIDDWEGGDIRFSATMAYNSLRYIEKVQVGVLVQEARLNSTRTIDITRVGQLVAGQTLSSYVAFVSGLVLQQEGFRFRNDDGTEATATWKYAQDANMTGAANTPFRVRFVINATGDPGARNWQLEYRRSATDNWRKVN